MKEATRRFLRDPPAGSRTRAAVEFGTDLSMTVRNMFELTPAERLDRLQRSQIDLRSIRRINPAKPQP